ncbi:MAG: DUF72 domain-containing protein [Gammaproteobacteria bacterium]|nr:DUF72 domain-containing protein [Gammaproteobacteria bacterium]MBU1556218.1 DUF72 domain-containing protein [Gammaproteobacteria bacterium]MBU2072262.1 DUF72 domain-containing protein [Gammaproteobacteria bacterium]MBU2181870.1 DUF72 domain-containing protein [Gammaproteobacteria bacterium]MBU2205115.1 DUF72 domain-containing protein [Gammaproteobacteria bacterium]
MLYLGCPLWANASWKQSVFTAQCAAADFLPQYSRVFNSVEGNTTFYADPSADTLQRWYNDTAADFRFILKVPQRISHQFNSDGLTQLQQWLSSLAPLAQKLALVHLQLSARTGPEQLPQLGQLVELISQHYRCAVEVRHPAFFDKAQNEIQLHKMLQQFNAERVVIDSRALFAVTATTDALREAQSKKPRVPVHAISFSQTPVLRFIGTDDMQQNRLFYQPWLKKVQQWLDQGKSPFCFFHTPDNQLAPQLCRQFASDLNYSHPCLAPWPCEQQFSLL